MIGIESKQKDQYKNCLCYSKEKGFYKKEVTGKENPKEVLFRSHRVKDYISLTREVPEKRIAITISSKFNYPSSSYLHAIVEINNSRVLDFDLEKLHILNRSSVGIITAPVYDWDTLFDKIIDKCKESSTNYDTSIIGYIDGIGDMLDKGYVLVKGYIEKESYTIWNDDFAVTLHAGNKIKDMLNSLSHADKPDEVTTKHLLDLCRKFLYKVVGISFEMSDKRNSQLSEALLAVHQFMCEHEAGSEYLKYILVKKS